MDEPPVDFTFLEVNAAGDPELMIEIIDLFLEQMAVYQNRLRQALEAGDHAGLKFIAHKVRSAAATFGASRFVQALEALEHNPSESDRRAALEPLVVRVLDQSEVVTEALKVQRQRLSTNRRT